MFPMSEVTTLSAGGPAFELAFSVSFRDPQTRESNTSRAVVMSRSGLLYQSADMPSTESPFPPPMKDENFAKWGNSTARKLLKEARYNPLQCLDIYDEDITPATKPSTRPKAIQTMARTTRIESATKNHEVPSVQPPNSGLTRSRSIPSADKHRVQGLPEVRPSYSPQFSSGCAYAERPESGTLVAMLDTNGVSQISNKSMWAKNAEESWQDFVNHICRPADHWQNLVCLPPLGEAHQVFSDGTLVEISRLISESMYLPLYLDGTLDAIVRSDLVAAIRVSRRQSDGKETASYMLKTRPYFEAGGFDWRGSVGANATALLFEYGDDSGQILPFIKVPVGQDDTLYIRRSLRWAVVDDQLVYLTQRGVVILRIPLPPNTHVPLTPLVVD